MQPQNSGSRGFRFGSIIIHSLWITLAGILLFRIATANTQSVVYVKIFGISGAILATGPWIIHFLVSTTIIVLYKAQVYDLTWLVKPPSEGGSCCWNSRAEDGDIKYDTWTSNGNGNAHRRKMDMEAVTLVTTSVRLYQLMQRGVLSCKGTEPFDIKSFV